MDNGHAPPLDPPADFGPEMFAAFQKSMSFATFSTDTVPAADRRAVTAELFAAAGRGELRAVVHELLPLEQAVLAHQQMQAGAYQNAPIQAAASRLP